MKNGKIRGLGSGICSLLSGNNDFNADLMSMFLLEGGAYRRGISEGAENYGELKIKFRRSFKMSP